MIPLIGLAIDGAVVFWAKARLSSAVDAAALAAGRSINMYYTQQQNSGPVVTVAQEWFNANFPAGWLGASVVGGEPTVTVQPTSTSLQQVNVSAEAVVPLFFMRMLGYSSLTVSATAQSARRNVFALLVLDRSGSMENNASGNACPTMQTDAINFVDSMFTENFDTVGLIAFSTTANSNPIDFGPSQTFKSGMATAINSISCVGGTSTAQALNVAYKTIQSKGLASGLNIIVFFTDGQPNELVANYSVKTLTDKRYGPGDSYGSYSTIKTFGPSGCNASTLFGGFTIGLSTGQTPATQGYTGGIFNTTSQVSLGSDANLISASGCAFPSSWVDGRLDVAYIPTSDYYGNSTNSGYGSNAPYFGNSVSTPDTFTSSQNGTSYVGQIRPDEQIPGVVAAAVNAADYQAQAILNNGTYNVIIYTIGLGGAPDFPVDATLLERIANDPRSPIYNSSLPTGFYAYAPSPGQLNQAFAQIASQILRLSQ